MLGKVRGIHAGPLPASRNKCNGPLHGTRQAGLSELYGVGFESVNVHIICGPLLQGKVVAVVIINVHSSDSTCVGTGGEHGRCKLWSTSTGFRQALLFLRS